MRVLNVAEIAPTPVGSRGLASPSRAIDDPETRHAGLRGKVNLGEELFSAFLRIDVPVAAGEVQKTNRSVILKPGICSPHFLDSLEFDTLALQAIRFAFALQADRTGWKNNRHGAKDLFGLGHLFKKVSMNPDFAKAEWPAPVVPQRDL